MSSEVDRQQRELKEMLSNFASEIESIGKSSGIGKSQKSRECEILSQEIRSALAAYQLEIGELSTPAEMSTHKKTLQDMKRELKRLNGELEWKKNEFTQENFSTTTAGVRMEDPAQEEEMSREQIVKEGDRVQDKTQDALNRMQRDIEETEALGNNIVAKQQEQLEQLNRVGDHMHDLQDNIKRARKTLLSISKHAAGDRCIQVVCGLIFIAVVVIVVLSITGFNNQSNPGDSSVNDSNVGSDSGAFRGKAEPSWVLWVLVSCGAWIFLPRSAS
uniref:t-SNARE coiled-coil homology domain-containing protein n=1 Tax=Chromera velia CCMP2878 TaxID=1169474 RepID=A0A0G4HDC3_9ALVE|eukprot:Cvel_26265.t1-p1 / transcript=Cvel_26265.t1 / gene=Cvel_26265 / organism=Chromera_velia_CCMP2878 / gene_product=Novel plant SNARE 11, putative / transcript_product=Novel plant SNARE 11, putative / location=Cvel_scaffold3099:2473-4645(-) / protein_length=273 / sequence_SO=supercontig / SO=protein_coding / is_pseudo=false